MKKLLLICAAIFTVGFGPQIRAQQTVNTDIPMPGSVGQPRTDLYIVSGSPVDGKQYLPKVAFKTNLLYWATTSPNFSAEFSLAPRWTLDATVGWNPWVWGDNKSLRHWLVQPELRYWFCRRFEGWFIGAHGIYGRFTAGNLPFGGSAMRDYIYRGYGYGGGLAAGYHWALARRWGVELTAGVGYVHLRYDKYECRECADLIGRFNRNYFGPTKVGLSLIYMIK